MAQDPARLRAAMADRISSRGAFRSAPVEHVVRTVPRHLFLPGVEFEEAYAQRPVVIKRAADGAALASASSPDLVAEMLQLLDVTPGHRVLEIGAATGYNAALLAELAGPTGTVVTVELDDDLATGARTNLAAAGYQRVEVICGDGAFGYPKGAPYDRIIVTAGAWDIPAAWWQQLAPGGRLVVPLRLHGSGLTRTLAFVRQEPDQLVSTSAVVCGFVPMRGADEHVERVVRLGDEVVLAIDSADQPDVAALADALSHPAHRLWTGIELRDADPAEHLDLWLATAAATEPSSYGRLYGPASPIDPAMRWAGATLYAGGTIACLTVRPRGDTSSELGIIAHGPASAELSASVATLLHRWAVDSPGSPTVTVRPTAAPPAESDIVRNHTRLTVTW